MKYYTLLLMALYLWGCANTKSISDTNNTRIFSATSLEVSNAITNYLTDDGWQIENLDMKSGLIKTYLQRILFNGDHRAISLSFMLQPTSDTQTSVEVNVFNQVAAAAGGGKDKWGIAKLGRKEQKIDDSEVIEYREQIFKKIENYLKH